MKMHRVSAFKPGAALCVALSALLLPPPAQSQTNTDAIGTAVSGARLLGKGVVSAYTKGGRWLIELPKAAFQRQFLWYTETVTVPPGVVSDLYLGAAVVRFQRRGNAVFVRNLTITLTKRSTGRQEPHPGETQGRQIDPMALSLRRSNEAPVMAVLPVIAAAPDGRTLVDATKLFSDDVAIASARPVVVKTGLVPAAVNPQASYVTSIRVFPQNFNVRAHLTFLAKNPKDPVSPPTGVSLRVSHSIAMLPEKPMAGRRFDPRVGFFRAGVGPTSVDAQFTVFDPLGRDTQQSFIMRYRLEKKDPNAAVSDPVKPIVFYLGREVPDRWRPCLKAAVEQWEPVFRAAGFSNAIVARNAPSFRDDPNWTPEDVRFSTIRWIAQPKANASGPHLVDPRSGEIVSSHVQVWPQVIEIFSRYYFAIHAALDPRIKSLPLSHAMRCRMLQYAVAHEVGHAIGLRHNHLASTVYTLAQMRDPKFANRWGANRSIMAYGRFNQAAQPGDGVTRFIPGIGPYDYFAIRFGYGVFGKTADEERKALDAYVAKAQADRRLRWAAGELMWEMLIWNADPRVQKENTGAERVEATRLGVANFLRSLKKLPAATGGDRTEFANAVATFLTFHQRLLKSVATEVAGVEADPWNRTGPGARVVPSARQRAAIRYLLGEGARSLDGYRDPAIAKRVSIFGLHQQIDMLQAGLIGDLFDGPKLSLLASQKDSDPKAYGVTEFAQDTYAAVWGDLTAAPRWRRALQRAYLARVGQILAAERAGPAAAEKARKALEAQNMPANFAAIAAATGAETVFPAWARAALPKLVARLDQAAKTAKSPNDRLHFAAMATLARRTAALGR